MCDRRRTICPPCVDVPRRRTSPRHDSLAWLLVCWSGDRTPHKAAPSGAGPSVGGLLWLASNLFASSDHRLGRDYATTSKFDLLQVCLFFAAADAGLHKACRRCGFCCRRRGLIHCVPPMRACVHRDRPMTWLLIDAHRCRSSFGKGKPHTLLQLTSFHSTAHDSEARLTACRSWCFPELCGGASDLLQVCLVLCCRRRGLTQSLPPLRVLLPPTRTYTLRAADAGLPCIVIVR